MADITLNAQLDGVDKAIEKAQQLNTLLMEAQRLIAELGEMNLSVDIDL